MLIVLFFQFFCMLKKLQVKKLGKVFFFFNWQGYYKIKPLRTEHSIILLKKKKKTPEPGEPYNA